MPEESKRPVLWAFPFFQGRQDPGAPAKKVMRM
jgi:hypothetical protein